MDYYPDLNDAINDCERMSDLLMDLNPDHELLQFDGTGLTPVELDQLTDLLMAQYGPPDYNSECPTQDELIFAFRSLHNALEAAVIIESARRGIYKPL